MMETLRSWPSNTPPQSKPLDRQQVQMTVFAYGASKAAADRPRECKCSADQLSFISCRPARVLLPQSPSLPSMILLLLLLLLLNGAKASRRAARKSIHSVAVRTIEGRPVDQAQTPSTVAESWGVECGEDLSYPCLHVDSGAEVDRHDR
uniref:Uncharacterized protein n=1 Tax=Anopheles atroparvus TaxID=41427 RepID=A0A182JBZ7_ANOAO